ESDEDTGVSSTPSGSGRGGRGSGQGGTPDANADPAANAADQPAQPPRPRTPVTVQIDFDGLQQRIISVQGIPERQYSSLRAGVPGTVYYLEAGAAAGRGTAGPSGSTLQRYRLSDRRAAQFVT